LVFWAIATIWYFELQRLLGILSYSNYLVFWCTMFTRVRLINLVLFAVVTLHLTSYISIPFYITSPFLCVSCLYIVPYLKQEIIIYTMIYWFSLTCACKDYNDHIIFQNHLFYTELLCNHKYIFIKIIIFKIITINQGYNYFLYKKRDTFIRK